MTTYFVGNYYEVTGSIVTKYYYAGAQRVAMRANGTLYFLLGDHLGSTSLTTNDSGNVVSEMRYTPWGEVRYNAGVTPTDYTYTGQYSNTADFGLMFYNARWYDPYLGRMAQADTIIPPGVQGLDRYAYTENNPVNYTDPSGHARCSEDGECSSSNPFENRPNLGGPHWNHKGNNKHWSPQNLESNSGFENVAPFNYEFTLNTNFSGGRDMSGDDFLSGVESTACFYAKVNCWISLINRLLPPKQAYTSNSPIFWVNFFVTHNEFSGIDISQFTLANGSQEPITVYINFEQGGIPYVHSPITVPGGNIYALENNHFDGSMPVTIHSEYQMIVDLGSASHPGPSFVYPQLIDTTIPNVPTIIELARNLPNVFGAP
ncbi:MAG: RHS repeat-associated core domain-containing protein [Anaerolineales bacterium]|nr:RHS repeat-associated core domain-containing protein [Anaerolineales bacterium]